MAASSKSTSKTTTKGTAKTTAAPAVKAEETKTETAPAAETKTTTKAAAPKTAAKKTTRKKTTTKRAAAKKDTTIDVKADVIVQFDGKEVFAKEIKKKVISIWESEGKKASAIKRCNLYIKPEDGKAYYVINGGLKTESTGDVDL